ncbi:MAG TPA: polysaccharide deacetylase family protein [Chitinophagaceae bacterium]|nr:polysaccharide deacetylase family protein [Chitinophagaceae bacterium]
MLLLYLPQITSRCKYIFDKIFTGELGLSYTTTSEPLLFKNYPGKKINYSDKRFSDEIFIKAAALLFENTIHATDLHISEKNGLKVLFTNDSSCDAGFDIFAAAFYMISRYEEYLPFTPDQYGRFDAKDSIAYKNDFLQIPVVDRWIGLLKNMLQKKFGNLLFKPSQFRAIVTYDIDVAYKFEGRSFVRNAGSIAKDVLSLNFKNIRQRNDVLKRHTTDPWDTYAYLKEKIEANRLPSIFFFLLAGLSKHDRNLDFRSPVMKQLAKSISAFSEIGIHPSFYSSSSLEKIIDEKKRLEEISGKQVTKSRQHFLKFELPDTYNYLIKAGIREDYSMGFPYEAGFRAGTCRPFAYYDLKNETAADLTIFPVTLMEGNFMKEKKFNKEKIIQTISKLLEEVKKTGGTFISIWHNHTVSDTNGSNHWRHIHEQMIEKIAELNS